MSIPIPFPIPFPIPTSCQATTDPDNCLIQNGIAFLLMFCFRVREWGRVRERPAPEQWGIHGSRPLSPKPQSTPSGPGYLITFVRCR
jgi:hypothetical protein